MCAKFVCCDYVNLSNKILPDQSVKNFLLQYNRSVENFKQTYFKYFMRVYFESLPPVTWPRRDTPVLEIKLSSRMNKCPMNKTKQGFFSYSYTYMGYKSNRKQKIYILQPSIPLSLDLGQRHSWNEQSNSKSRSGRDTTA